MGGIEINCRNWDNFPGLERISVSGLGGVGTSGLEGIGAFGLGKVSAFDLEGVGTSVEEESIWQAFNSRVVENVANPCTKN